MAHQKRKYSNGYFLFILPSRVNRDSKASVL
nr:MAG TPA_asm: hypothetical protein [Bacteriophage sp.]